MPTATIMPITIPARLTTPLFLLLHLAACGTDTSVGTDSTVSAAVTDSPGSAAVTDSPGSTLDSPTSSSGGSAATSGAAVTTSTAGTHDAGSSSTTSGVVTGADPTTGAGDGSGTTSTGTEPPPPDLCAQQDGPPPDVAPREAINDDPAFIQVYVNNIENLKLAGEQCPGDWTDLIYYMKTIEPSPDLFLVQQVSDAAQLEALVERMNKELPGIFEGIIADADPWTQQSPCGEEKAQQTNAIIIRQGRFSTVGDKHVWQSWAKKNGDCVRNNQARTRNVMIRLHDKIADRDLTVASIHWSTSQGDGDDPACAEKNVLEADQKVHQDGFGGDLVLFGGDFNEPDRKGGGEPHPWYAQANGDGGGGLNYRDPIYSECLATADLQACLDDNWTIGSDRRIDMLFAQDGNGCRARTARAHTITFNQAEAAAKDLTGSSDANLDYSDHRAVRAEFYY